MPAPLEFKSLLAARCSDDPERLKRYEVPERGTPGHAACVLVPETAAEIAAVLRTANAARLPLVVSAGRTGLVEAQRPEGESVLSLERLNRPLSLALADGREFRFAAQGNPDRWRDELSAWRQSTPAGSLPRAGATLTAEAGLAIDALNHILEPLGLMWPVEMGSSSAATVGACVANGSAGANAVCYGTAAHMCEAAWGLWGKGQEAGPCVGPAWTRPGPERLAIDSAAVRPELGLIGSQGVLGVITRVQLRLHPIPAQREGVLLPVAGMPTAMAVLNAARAAFPGAVEEFEFLSRTALELVRALRGEAFRSPLAAHDEPYYVLLQVKSDDPDEDLAGRLYRFVGEDLALPDERIGYAPLKDLKAIRHSVTESSNHRMKQLGGGRLAFDTATPTARFGDYLAGLEAEIARRFPGVELVAFGHAGVGGAHLHLLGTRERPVAAHAADLIQLVFDVTARYGGTFSAEHGVGSKWGAEFLRRAAPDMLARLVAAKRERDPGNILNPRCLGMDRALAAP